MRAQLECYELHLGEGEKCAESLWVKIIGRAVMANITVGLYCRSENQEAGSSLSIPCAGSFGGL